MSDGKFSLSGPIPFDDFFGWLTEFVKHSVARENIFQYERARRRHLKDTGSMSAWDEDDEARNARNAYMRLAFDVLESHGWPNYADMMSGARDKKNIPISTNGRDIPSEMRSFADIGSTILLGGFAEDFWNSDLAGLKVDISDKDSVRNFVQRSLRAGLFESLANLDVGARYD